MTRAEFLALTVPEQLATIWDLVQRGQSASPSGSSADALGDGRAPKYDRSIARKDGMVQYASECSAKELQYWITQAKKPPKDPKYAEKNQKQATALGYFLAYRLANPTEQWNGERNKFQVTAAPPSDKPAQYPRDAAAGAAEPTEPTPGFDDDIPF
jgi:hypothetical protein